MVRKTKIHEDMDRIVGLRLREARVVMGLSCAGLGEKIDITGQQLYKYEIASNRVSAGRLYYLAQHLNKPLSYFFDSDIDYDAGDRLSLELLRNFNSIEDERLRASVNKLVLTMARCGI